MNCPYFHLVSFRFSNPNEASLSAIGKVFKPNSVSRYSTLGGISGYDFLDTIPFCTKKFNSCINIFSLMPGMHLFNSPYRSTLSLIWNNMSKVHLPPSKANDFLTGQFSSDSLIIFSVFFICKSINLTF